MTIPVDLINSTLIEFIKTSHHIIPWESPYSRPKGLHTCQPGCSFYCRSGSDLYVCKRSGNLHYCTDEHCKHCELLPDSRVCVLTARVFPLELRDYEDSDRLSKGNLEKGNPMGITDQPTPPVKPVNTRKRKLQPVFHLHSNSTESIEVIIHNIKTESIKTIQTIFAASRDQTQHKYAEWADLCQILWMRIQETEHYKQSINKYKLKNHVVAVIKNMTTGFRDIVLHDELVYKHLPSSKLIADILQIEHSVITRATKDFQTCCQQLLAGPTAR